MVCKKCGAEIPEDSKVCPECGESMYHKVTEAADSFFDKAEAEVSAAIHDASEEIHSENNGSNELRRLSTDRGLISYILLSIITFGIYSYYFIYMLAKDVNVACEDDGQKTAGLVKFILLSFITCGIYSWFWYYNLGNRLSAFAPRYGLTFQENGTTILLWFLFGALLFGIGPFVAMHILIKNTNAICAAYNAKHNL